MSQKADGLVPGASGAGSGKGTGPDEPTAGWAVVADRELRDLWLGGRGLVLLVAFAALLSVTFYLSATDQALNFLEQREAVNLTLQMTVAVGGLLALLAAADSVSGERDRGTLETLLLTPVSRRSLVVGKAVAALSLWIAAFAVAVPALWFLAGGVGLAGVAVLAGLVVGSLLSLFLVGYGLTISCLSGSSRFSLAVSLFGLLAIYAPSQLPTAAQRGWAGELLQRIDPIAACLHYLGAIVVNAHPPGRDADWLIGPVIAAVLAPAVALAVAGRLGLGRASQP
jgi:ABC-2 type transport system permease protein